MRSIAAGQSKRVLWVLMTAAIVAASVTHIDAQSVATDEAAGRVRQALLRLPYYGVFDFLAFSVDRGTVTLEGYSYRGNLIGEAEVAVRRVSGVDDVANKIDLLSASQNDDRIRWATFYNIYTEDFLSRYAPGGPMAARYDLIQSARFPGRQPFGMYPIHIIVQNGRTTLLGIVDAESDRTLATVRARQVPLVFGVDNDIVVSR